MELKIFKAYDVRGIYPTEINEEAVYRIAKAYTYVIKPTSVVVGMDARLSSPSLKESLISGLLKSGVDVFDIGQITTDMLYYTVGANKKYSGGIIVSASHNPKEYNGLKMVREEAAAISSDTGLLEIRKILDQGKDAEISSKKNGTYHQIEIIEDYVKHVMKFIDTSIIRNFTFVGNGNFGFVNKALQRIVKQLNINVIPLNLEPDGSFPKGPPDPLLADNRLETQKLIVKSGADFGAAWDADADRVMFFDEKGNFISGAYIGALLAKIMLEKYPNNKIICDPRTIWPMLKTVKEMNGELVISKCGHTFMKDKMRSLNALFASEMSAHYYFRDNFYADNGIIPFLLILEYLSKKKQKFSEIVQPIIKDHHMSGEINYRVKDVNEIIKKIKELYIEGKKDELDGYSIEGENWRFNIRASNTEPLLRLNIEAKHIDIVNKIKKEIEEVIHG